MGQSLFKELFADRLPEAEMRHMLSTQFGHGSMTRPTEVDYSDQQRGEPALTMVYDDTGQLIDIRRGPALIDDALERLQAAIQLELDIASFSIARSVLFASVPVANSWRFRDELAIVPVPPDAPRPHEILGDHPFLLEVRHPNAGDYILRQMRARERLRQWELLLALVVGYGIHGLPRYTSRHWVLVVASADPLTLETQFLQDGYFADLASLPSEDFSDTVSPPMSVVEDEAFFSRRGISVDDVLCVPECLTLASEAFTSLGPLERQRFLRACYWFQLSERQWSLSHSASYVSLAQSIECLVYANQVKGPHCASCGKPVQGVTRAFYDFVERYAQGTAALERRRLYRLRSRIAHGGELFSSDLNLSFTGLLPIEWEERGVHDEFNRLARIVLINYLLSRPTLLLVGTDSTQR